MAEQTAICSSCQSLSYDPRRAVPPSKPPYEYVSKSFVVPLRVIPLDSQLDDEFPQLPKLRESIKNGCPMCHFLKDVIWSHVRSGDELLVRADAAMVQDKKDPLGPNLKIRISLDEFHPDPVAMNFVKGPSKWPPLYISGRITIGDFSQPLRLEVREGQFSRILGFPEGGSLSTKSLQCIQGWIDTCTARDTTGHESCSKEKQTLSPLRLLEVMSGDNVRLKETEGLQVQYTILSYCWGTSPDVLKSRTVPSNLSLRLSGFSLRSLPQTLQDSVTLTRRLGISYIWIDALCIVQDSDEWVTESLRMMQYYENAYLTIIPVACSSADQGFLGRRPWWVTKTIDWTGPPDRKLQFFFPGYTRISNELERSVWITRGWTFQERLLSARSLFVGRHCMMFECRFGYGSEDVGPEIRSDPTIAFLPASAMHAAQSKEWNQVSLVRSKWYQLAAQYAGRKLTNESDRLVALSGVASKFRQLLGDQDTYLDGFWKNDLWGGLLWRIPAGEFRSKPVLKSPHFPSWSWCSVNRVLNWGGEPESVACAKLVDIIKNPHRGTNGFGPEITGLIITTWGFPLSLLKTELPAGLEIDTYLDDGSSLIDNINKSSGKQLTAVALTAYLHEQDEHTWAFDRAAEPHDVHGLILRATSQVGASYPTYQRAGVFEVIRHIESYWDFDDDGSAGGFSESSDDEFEKVVPVQDFENTSAPDFYKKVYASTCTITLV
ncbi:hypothetical protein QQZ08_011480 [Neonectria magnoliae]|uniref:Heterokaryon incompatibility domain-containing protein n=1 Tax=Neonectria magnoliae TaxID=2732573 RepID=A0ABR1HA65_9HYPO